MNVERNEGPWANLNDPIRKIFDEDLEKVLPKPRPGEDRKKFRERCLADPKVNEEFPESAQRFAVCSRQAGIDPDEE